MKSLVYGYLLYVLLFGLCSCHSGKGSDRKPEVDSVLVVLSDTIVPEYYFAGLFTYMADAAVLRDYSIDTDIPVAMRGEYITAERRYLELTRDANEPVYLQVKGRLVPKEVDEEGPDMQLSVSHIIKMETTNGIAVPPPVTGNYSSEVSTLSIMPDHTFRFRSRNGIGRHGKWYLRAPGTVELTEEQNAMILDVDNETRALVTRDIVPVVYHLLDK